MSIVESMGPGIETKVKPLDINAGDIGSYVLEALSGFTSMR